MAASEQLLCGRLLAKLLRAQLLLVLRASQPEHEEAKKRASSSFEGSELAATSWLILAVDLQVQGCAQKFGVAQRKLKVDQEAVGEEWGTA